MRPALQLLLCPILDHSRVTESRRLYSHGFLVEQSTLDHDLLHYLPPGADVQDPRISPLLAADLKGLPPTLVHTAEYDPLRDEGRAYFERLEEVGAARAYTLPRRHDSFVLRARACHAGRRCRVSRDRRGGARGARGWSIDMILSGDAA